MTVRSGNSRANQAYSYAPMLLVGTGASAEIWHIPANLGDSITTAHAVSLTGVADAYGEGYTERAVFTFGVYDWCYDAELDVVWASRSGGLTKVLADSPYTETQYTGSFSDSQRIHCSATGRLWWDNGRYLQTPPDKGAPFDSLTSVDMGEGYVPNWFEPVGSDTVYYVSSADETAILRRYVVGSGGESFDLSASVSDGTTLRALVHDATNNCIWVQAFTGEDLAPCLVQWSIASESVAQVILLGDGYEVAFVPPLSVRDGVVYIASGNYFEGYQPPYALQAVVP